MGESIGCTYKKEVKPIKVNVSSLKVEVKFEKAEKFIRKLNQMKYQILLLLEKRKADQDYFNIRLKNRPYCGRLFCLVYEKKEQLQHLKEALQESTAEEKYRMIQKLCHRMQHGNKNIAEERTILREIKRREKISFDDDKKQTKRYHWTLGKIPETKGGIKDLINIIRSELEELKKKQMPFIVYENKIRKEIEAAKNDICFFERQLEDIDKKKHKLYCTFESYPIARTKHDDLEVKIE